MESLVNKKEVNAANAQRFGTVKRIGKLLFKLAVCILSLVDFFTDFLLGIEYASQGHTTYAIFTFLFTLLPTACGALYVLRYLRRKSELTLVNKIIFSCCLFLQTHFVASIWFIEDLYKKKRTIDKSEQKKKERVQKVLTMFDAFEALPQLSFQFTILLGEQGHCTYLQLFTVISSLFTGAWKLTTLIDLNNTSMKVFMFFINFSWLLPESVILGFAANRFKTLSYIATPVRFLITVILNLTYFRRSNAVKKKWSEWLKSVIFSLFVPFYMFSRIGAYLVTVLLFSVLILSGFMQAEYDYKDIKWEIKFEGNVTYYEPYFFNNKVEVDLIHVYDKGGHATMQTLALLAMISSFVLISKCCCCCSHMPFLDIEERNEAISVNGNHVDSVNENQV